MIVCPEGPAELNTTTERFVDASGGPLALFRDTKLQGVVNEAVPRRRRHAIILASAPNLLHKEVTKCDPQL